MTPLGADCVRGHGAISWPLRRKERRCTLPNLGLLPAWWPGRKQWRGLSPISVVTIDLREEYLMNHNNRFLFPAGTVSGRPCAAALVLPCLRFPASADGYPSRTNLPSSVPSPQAAAPTLPWCATFANGIQEMTGHTIIVDNKPRCGRQHRRGIRGASRSGRIHGLCPFRGTATAMNYHLWHNPPIDPREQLRGVAGINNAALLHRRRRRFPASDHRRSDRLPEKRRATRRAFRTTATSGRVFGAQFVADLDVDAG